MTLSEREIARLRISHIGFLAPAMQRSAQDFIDMMTARGHDPVIIETLRLAALQAAYFARGTSRQKDILRSMHGHGLAFDVISKSRGWAFTPEWKSDVQECCAALGLTCGGLWKSPVDWPHVQHGRYLGAVPDALVAAFNRGGLYASWEEAQAFA